MAIDVLIAGGTHSEASEAAEVHRVTVSRWVTKVPGFEAELNRRRTELLSERADRIRALDGQALAVVAAQIDDGDPAVAMQWLRLRRIGAVPAEAIGPTDPDHVIDAKVEHQRRDLESLKFKLLTEDLDPSVPSRENLSRGVLREAADANVEE